jgi:hypothetical protein
LRQLSLTGLFLLLLAAGACQQPAPDKPAPGQAPYFDVPAFIQAQAALLEKENPGASKAVMEGSQVQERKTMQNLNWQKELAAFSELDLNKPAFRNTFRISRQQDAAGLVTETYRKQPGTEGDIVFLSVTTGPNRQVRALQARRINENPLISTVQELALTCGPENGRFRLQTLQISGQQKPIIFDTLHYMIITKIH